MNDKELYDLVFKRLPLEEIHPLHKAILEESCEVALKTTPEIKDKEELIRVVLLTFELGDSTLKETLKALAEKSNSDQINLNYRGQKFVFSKDSPFLK